MLFRSIDEGLFWNAERLIVERYDPACRLRQCFKCQAYSHIGPQCHSKEKCGWCAGPHNTRSCPNTKDETTRRCSNCSGSHTAWSKSCEMRLKEVRKVQDAREHRARYHHVPVPARKEQPYTQTLPTQVRPQAQSTPSQPPISKATGKRVRTSSNSVPTSGQHLDGAMHPERQLAIEAAAREGERSQRDTDMTGSNLSSL